MSELNKIYLNVAGKSSFRLKKKNFKIAPSSPQECAAHTSVVAYVIAFVSHVLIELTQNKKHVRRDETANEVH